MKNKKRSPETPPETLKAMRARRRELHIEGESEFHWFLEYARERLPVESRDDSLFVFVTHQIWARRQGDIDYELIQSIPEMYREFFVTNGWVTDIKVKDDQLPAAGIEALARMLIAMRRRQVALAGEA